MSPQPQFENQVDRFILDEIETVPHLEALLLIWNSRPQPWTVDNLAKRLYVSGEKARLLLEDLVRRSLASLVRGAPDGYQYLPQSAEKDQLLADVDATYRRELVRISTMIHSKPSPSVRAFAQAFRLTKDRE